MATPFDSLNYRKYPALPNGYQKLEFIQNTADLYIDTGYITKVNNFTVELDIAWTGTDVGKFESFFGFMYSASTVTPRFGIHKYNSKLMFGANQTTVSSTDPVKNQRFLYKAICINGNQKLYKNSTEIASNTTAFDFSTNTSPHYLFSRNCQTSEKYTRMKFYELKYYESSALKMWLVPVKRKSDNKIGVFDLIRMLFLTPNQNGTAFTLGDPVPETTEIYTDTLTFKNKIVSKITKDGTVLYNKDADLPEAYTLLKYIGTTPFSTNSNVGSQYIQTNIKVSDRQKIDITFSNTGERSETAYCSNYLMSDGYNSLSGGGKTDGSINIAANGSSVGAFPNVIRTANTLTKFRLIHELNYGNIYGSIYDYQNDRLVNLSGTYTQYGNVNKYIHIFTFGSTEQSTRRHAGCRIHECKIWQFSESENKMVLVANLVPAKRNSDNALGLYNKVSGDFFINNGDSMFTSENF